MNTMDIVKENEWLIYKIAKNFYNADKDDLYQAGVLGILKALQNYQKNGTAKFSTYAYEYIFGEMYQMVYKNQSIKVSKDILRSYQKIEIARSSLAQKIHKFPTNMELAEFLEMDISLMEQIINYGSIFLMSMDAEEKEERSYYETIAKEEVLSMDDSLAIKEGMDMLNTDEQKIIAYRYFNDMTQQEVAEKLHMTQVMVSRYEKKSLLKMQSYYDGMVA